MSGLKRLLRKPNYRALRVRAAVLSRWYRLTGRCGQRTNIGAIPVVCDKRHADAKHEDHGQGCAWYAEPWER